MRIFAKAKTGARVSKIEEIKESRGNEKHLIVYVREKPIDGSANKAIIKALAEYFRVPAYAITLVSGSFYKEKVFEIE